MKHLVAILAIGFVGVAQAQSFDWNRAWSGCSAEASAFDAESRRQSTPEHTARKVVRYVEEVTGTPPTAAKLRAKMEEDQGVLSNSKDWAYLIQLSSKLALCGTTAALNQLQNGSTQAASPSRSPVTQREPQENKTQCVRGRVSDSSLVNECGRRVNIAWCSLPHDRSSSTNFHCESQRFSWIELSAGDKVTVDENAQIAWTTCDSPTRPADVRYVSGRGVEGKCQR